MARKPAAKRSSKGAKADATPARDRVVDAFMELLAARGYGDIALADIAEASGVSLAEMRGLHRDKGAILADFAKRIDQAVLADGPAEGESARDRLFDVMMRRFDALAPYKAAVASLARSVRTQPGLAVRLACIGAGAQSWLFAAAGLRPRGFKGAVALRGSGLVFGEALRVWLKDDEPDLGATMAALDRALQRGDRVMRFLDDCAAFACRFAERRRDEAAA